jgi:hypothetical protein
MILKYFFFEEASLKRALLEKEIKPRLLYFLDLL